MLSMRKCLCLGFVSLLSWLATTTHTQAAFTLVETFTVGDGLSNLFVGLGFDTFGERVYVYQQFDSVIGRFTTTGVADGVLPLSGGTAPSSRFDLDFAPAAFNLGSGVAPENSLLVFNGNLANEIYSVDKTTGAVHSFIAYGPIMQMVGGAYHQPSDTFFTINISPTDFIKLVLPTASIATAGFSPAPFDVFFGDLEVDQSTGNLLLVSSQHSFIRVVDPNGLFIEEINVAPFGVGDGGLSGIALDDSTGDIWLLQLNGRVLHLVQETAAVPEPSSLTLLALGGIGQLVSRLRRTRSRLPHK
jgi:hypothetical protein